MNNMHIPQEMITNRAFDMRAMAFNHQLSTTVGPSLPWFRGPVPEGAVTQPDGSVRLSMFAPEAKQVQAGTWANMIDLERSDIGLWTGTLQLGRYGLHTVTFKVDGCDVLNPMAPTYYSNGKAANYVEIPDPEQDYLLLKDVPHGAVTREFYHSGVTGAVESCLVYTPPLYQEEPEKDYPVVYLQHGGGENETAWIYQGKTNFLMDNLIAEGRTLPFIIVMNSGGTLVWGDGEWTCDYHLLPDVVVHDCIPFIEQKYRVRPGPEHRAFAGLSMGSLQGGWAMMRFPGVFSAFGLFTGFKDPQLGWDKEKQPWLAALEDSETFNRQTKLLHFSFGEEENRSGILEDHQRFLDGLGIRYVARTYPGAHEWRNWRAAFADFSQMVFRW